MLFIEFHPKILKSQGWSFWDLLQTLDSFGFVPFALTIRHRPSILITNIKSIDKLMKNRYLMNNVFHGFFKKSKRKDN